MHLNMRIKREEVEKMNEQDIKDKFCSDCKDYPCDIKCWEFNSKEELDDGK